MFKFSSLRLLRNRWRSSQMLAEEIYAILRGAGDLEHDGTVVINEQKGSTEPALTIRQYPGSTQPSISITRINPVSGLPETLFQVGPSGVEFAGDEVGGGGGADLSGVDFGEDQDEDATPESPLQTPFVLRGYVASKDSGASYNVQIWGLNPAAYSEMATVTAVCDGIDEDDDCSGQYVSVHCYPSSDGSSVLEYRFTVPLWQE